MERTSLVDWIALGLIPRLGNRTALQLINHFGDPTTLFAVCKKEKEICKGIRASLRPHLQSPGQFRSQAASLLQRLETFGGAAICLHDTRYPSLLKQIADPPHVIYVQGNIALLHNLSVALVGSRAATAYGKRAAFSLAKSLAQSGVTVVSGVAMGVDSQAHQGALAAQGATIGVLGCGLDVVYPRVNAKLYEKIRGEGLLVSEYPLGTKPEGFRFPARNRIIAGLCRGVVVVEAAKKSGSLITAEMALEEGRDIFAVPGQIDSFKSSGSHWLLQQGAKLVQSTEDILVEYGAEVLSPDDETAKKAESSIDQESGALLNHIEVYPVSRDELIAKSGLPSSKVAELLLMLELEGLVEMVPGDGVRRLNAG